MAAIASSSSKQQLKWTYSEEVLLYNLLLICRPYLFQTNGGIDNIWKHISSNILFESQKTFSVQYLLDQHKKLYTLPPSASFLELDIANNSVLCQLKTKYLRNETNWKMLSAETQKQKLQMMANTRAFMAKIFADLPAMNQEKKYELFRIGKNFLWLIETRTVGEIQSILGKPRQSLKTLRSTLTSMADSGGIGTTIDLMRIKICVSPLIKYTEVFNFLSMSESDKNQYISVLNVMLQLYHCKQSNVHTTESAANKNSKLLKKWFNDIKSFVLECLSSLPRVEATDATTTHVRNVCDSLNEKVDTPPPLLDFEPESEKVPLLKKQRIRLMPPAPNFEIEYAIPSTETTPPPSPEESQSFSPVKVPDKNLVMTQEPTPLPPPEITSIGSPVKLSSHDDAVLALKALSQAEVPSKRKVSHRDTAANENRAIAEDFIIESLRSQQQAIMYEEGQMIKLEKRKLALKSELLSIREEELALKVKMYQLRLQNK